MLVTASSWRRSIGNEAPLPADKTRSCSTTGSAAKTQQQWFWALRRRSNVSACGQTGQQLIALVSRIFRAKMSTPDSMRWLLHPDASISFKRALPLRVCKTRSTSSRAPRLPDAKTTARRCPAEASARRILPRKSGTSPSRSRQLRQSHRPVTACGLCGIRHERAYSRWHDRCRSRRKLGCAIDRRVRLRQQRLASTHEDAATVTRLRSFRQAESFIVLTAWARWSRKTRAHSGFPE